MEYGEIINYYTTPINQVELENIEPFRWLSNSIREGKENLTSNTVDFIIIKILDNNKKPYKFIRKKSFDVYVIGTFRKFFNPTLEVAEAFSDFYLEMGLLPNIISVPKNYFLEREQYYSKKIKNGILIYDRN
jgi:hypothetical protein